MGSVYKKGRRWYIRFKDPDGNWISRAAADTKAEARVVLKEVEKQLHEDAARVAHLAPGQRPLREYVEPWVQRRHKRGIRNWKNDRADLENHILPAIGDMPVEEIRVRHVRDLVDDLIAKDLAPRTVRRMYGTFHKFMSDLVVDEVVTHTPCVLTKDQLPANVDKDPEWRSTAIYSREEVQLLVSSPLIPEDRRIIYGLLFLTGCRIGEIIGLRWRALDPKAEPLWRMSVMRSYSNNTKTKKPREVPVHPTLQAMLVEWKKHGFQGVIGRRPREDDLVVPSREDRMRSRHHTRNKLIQDLARLGFRHRRTHDTRRTFITLARVGGARKDVLEHITHSGRGNIMDLYTTLPWPTLCEAVLCLKLDRLSGKALEKLIAEQKRRNEGGNGQDSNGGEQSFVTGFVTDDDESTSPQSELAGFIEELKREEKWRRRESNGHENPSKSTSSVRIGGYGVDQIRFDRLGSGFGPRIC